MLKPITIDCHSATPKYMQVANAIIAAINKGELAKDEILPSINELSFESEISRDTAEKGYNYLKKIGVIGSVHGKGYFVKHTKAEQHPKIFLLFNKLSTHKKIIYDAFVASLSETASIDFYIYNNDYILFKKLLQNKKNDYTHYVIIPHFIDGGENAHKIINATIPNEKLILLDKRINGIKGQYGAVYENFKKDIYQALEQALTRLAKYHTLKIIFPADTYHSTEILEGFVSFCEQFSFKHKVVHDILSEPIQAGEVFISLMEDDLVTLVEKILATQLKIGEQVGIISYNEIPLKKIILDGITTISTDFRLMGKKAADLILSSTSEHVEVPFYLTLRSSL